MDQEKSPLNKKQATHALCKQSSTHLGRRSGESNRLAHAIEQHLPISSDCTKLLVAVCSYGQDLFTDVLTSLSDSPEVSHRQFTQRAVDVDCHRASRVGGVVFD